ncbi:MAG TPA: GGDEF domain-containing protein [Polyangiaceae bacterium]
MFWKKSAPAERRPSSAPRQREDYAEHALDTLASVVRSFGLDAFDIDDATADVTRAECERWAQRITVGDGHGGDEGGTPREFRRDWGGLRRYFSAHRAHERDYVQRSLTTMREAVQTFARCLTSALSEDRSADERLGTQLTRLVEAFQDNDADAIRREAESVLSVAQDAIQKRRKRQAAQVALLSEKIQALREELHQARELAALDPLTHLYNRNALDAHLERVSDLAFLLSSSPCLLMIDVDHFKAVNDRYGHPVGDEVLRRVADALVRQFLRREDFVARYGGEEFVVVIPDSTLDNARKRAERVREAVGALAIPHPGGTLQVTISVGISCLASGDNGKSWLSRADASLYEAKAAGRNTVRVSPFPAHSVASLRPTPPAPA